MLAQEPTQARSTAAHHAESSGASAAKETSHLVEPILRQIESAHIRTIKVEFPDLFGVARAKAVPARQFPHAVEHGVQFAFPTFALDLAGNPASGTGTAEETGYADMTAIPDLSTFTILPWEPHTAAVIADLYYAGEPLSLAPRNILKRVVAEYEKRNLLPIVGSELEFYLLRLDNGSWRTYSEKPSMVYTWNSTIDPDAPGRKMPGPNPPWVAIAVAIAAEAGAAVASALRFAPSPSSATSSIPARAAELTSNASNDPLWAAKVKGDSATLLSGERFRIVTRTSTASAVETKVAAKASGRPANKHFECILIPESSFMVATCGAGHLAGARRSASAPKSCNSK